MIAGAPMIRPSPSHAPVATDRLADRKRNTDPDDPDDEGDHKGVEEPTGLGLTETGLRGGREQLRPDVLEPLEEHVDDDCRGNRAEEQAERPADPQADPVRQLP